MAYYSYIFTVTRVYSKFVYRRVSSPFIFKINGYALVIVKVGDANDYDNFNCVTLDCNY